MANIPSRHSRLGLPSLRAASVCAGLLFGILAAPAGAQDIQSLEDTPALITADEISYDRELGIVSARGGVEIAQGERILLADMLSFNQRTDVLTASGNIKILEPSGEVIFADYVELSDEMRNGVIEGIRVLLADNARLAANGARRQNGNRTVLAKGVYSPCLVCEEDPSSDPLWQVKAKRVIHDQRAREIQYEDAFLEVFGVPVAYTPYFQHPDPTVQRETGLLIPEYGSNSNTGTFVRVPYFFVIDESRDATVDPIYTTGEGLVYAGEYRQRFDKGLFEASGSVTIADRRIGDTAIQEVKEDEWRGHVFAKARYDIDDHWRAGADIERSSDNTYLRRFDFFEDTGNVNTSNAYIEGFNGRNYISGDAYVFQDLRTGTRPDEPLVLPLIAYDGLGEPDQFGGRWSLESSFRYLEQSDRAESGRFSVDGGYELPYTTDFGLAIRTAANLRMDAYQTDHNRATDDVGRPVEDGFESRLRPEFRIEARYPFVRSDASGDTIIEPVVAFLASPNGGNSANISNDDSTVVEIDETNLFDVNRTPGLDRVEGGQRYVYGLKVARHFAYGGYASAFIGQTEKITQDRDLGSEAGLGDGKSDIVGRIDLRPTQYVDGFFRFRYDEDSRRTNRSELALRVGSSALQATFDYTFLRDTASVNAAQVDEATIGVAAQWDDYWRFFANTVQNLGDDRGSIQHAAGLVYEDECLLVNLNYTRSFTGTVDDEPSQDILLRVTFKTLTAVETNLF